MSDYPIGHQYYGKTSFVKLIEKEVEDEIDLIRRIKHINSETINNGISTHQKI